VGSVLYSNDERFLGVAHELTDFDWAEASLCADWTNHEVLAHLVHGRCASIAQFAGRMVAARGSFDAANASLARDLAARRSPRQLLDDLHRVGGNWCGLGRLLPAALRLGDHVVHELDIMFALERPSTVPPDVLAAVLSTEVRIPNPFVPARSRAAALTLRATDIDWSRPGRPDLVVAGAGADLASVLAGRTRALSRLSGPGVAVLAHRLSGTRDNL
jgi:uncharacterized protein (TIGR03083 family)